MYFQTALFCSFYNILFDCKRGWRVVCTLDIYFTTNDLLFWLTGGEIERHMTCILCSCNREDVSPHPVRPKPPVELYIILSYLQLSLPCGISTICDAMQAVKHCYCFKCYYNVLYVFSIHVHSVYSYYSMWIVQYYSTESAIVCLKCNIFSYMS